VRFGAWMMGSQPSLVFISQRCVPRRFLDAGFVFRFSRVGDALYDLCRKQ
jgi:uncharacterized protein